MCMLTHKHRRRSPERAAVIIGTLSVRAPAPEQGRLAQAADPVLVEEAGAGPGVAGGGAADLRVLNGAPSCVVRSLRFRRGDAPDFRVLNSMVEGLLEGRDG